MTQDIDFTIPENNVVKFSITLRGEEAVEFLRWRNKQNIKNNHAGKILVLEGMKKLRCLPDWWPVK